MLSSHVLRYGRLDQMEVSIDGQMLVLLTRNKVVSTVFIIDIANNEVKDKLVLRECSRVVLSPDNLHLLTEYKNETGSAEVCIIFWHFSVGVVALEGYFVNSDSK